LSSVALAALGFLVAMDVLGPLEGIRVLDCSGALGAYCTKLLANFGADVIKVEPPDGDELRHRPPFKGGIADVEKSLLHTYYHDNKRGVTLAASRPEAQRLLAELSASSDVVVVSPGRDGHTIGFDDGTALVTAGGPWDQRNLVVCAISPLGLEGPNWRWRATPFTSYAMGGLMFVVGPPEGPPMAIPGQQAYDEAGIHGALAVLAALFDRAQVEGQVVDLSVHEVMASQDRSIERFSTASLVTNRTTNFGPPPGGIWQCSDGRLDIASHSERHWAAFLETLGMPEELCDPLFADRAMRVQLFDLVTELVTPLLANVEVHDFVRRGQANGLPCAVFNSPESFLQDEQARSRNFFVENDRPHTGKLEMPGTPYVTTPSSLISYRRPAPLLGEHNEEIYGREMGHSVGTLREWRRDGLV